jgi:ABC-type branched-subunit amino acid transport system ATPase component
VQSWLAHVFEVFPPLKERVTQLGGTMSGGEQAMLSIGRGLMAAPKLLIIDEPSLGLSPPAMPACCVTIPRYARHTLENSRRRTPWLPGSTPSS